MVVQVDHIGIAVASLDESLKFYTDMLGMKLHGTEKCFAVKYCCIDKKLKGKEKERETINDIYRNTAIGWYYCKNKSLKLPCLLQISNIPLQQLLMPFSN